MKRLFTIAFLVGLFPGVLSAGPFQTVPVPYEPKPRPEFYVFGYGGINWLTDFEGIAQDGAPEFELDADNGWGAGGGLGLRSDWLGGTRLEVEGFHRSNDIDELLVGQIEAAFPADAEAEITGVSVNFIKELVWGSLYPYVGLGLGYGEMDVDLQASTVPGPGVFIDDHSSAFLWQVIAGLDFPYTQRTSLYLEYRYMPLSDFDLEYIGPVEMINYDDVSTHSIFAGIRFAF